MPRGPNEIELFCDESGNTGPALLDQDQRYFAFSSVAISDTEAAEIIREARARFPVQMPELKAAKLLRSPQGLRLAGHILTSVKGRYAVTVHDKMLALCAHFFEYVLEPVFKNDPQLLYTKNLHRFVAMVLYVWFHGREADAQRALDELQAYLRTLDADRAPLLFSLADNATDRDPFDSLLRFARASRGPILADNASIPGTLPDKGVWLGDLATTSLWSHLNHWGSKGLPIALTCDESKPLASNMKHMSGDGDDPGIAVARQRGHTESLGWRYSRQPTFGDSKQHAALQVADVVAGITAYVFRPNLHGGSELDGFRQSLFEHALGQSILPDFEHINPERREAAVNAAILYRLAEKAEAGADLHSGLAADYHFAESQWDAGALRLA